MLLKLTELRDCNKLNLYFLPCRFAKKMLYVEVIVIPYRLFSLLEFYLNIAQF